MAIHPIVVQNGLKWASLQIVLSNDSCVAKNKKKNTQQKVFLVASKIHFLKLEE